MFGHFPQAVYIGFSVLSRNDEARSPRLTMEVMKQGTGGELRDESWRGTGDKGREAHRLMKRVSFVRRAFDDKEYFSCGFIFVAFYRRFNEQKGEFVRQHFFLYLSFLYRLSRESENVSRLVNSRRQNV